MLLSAKQRKHSDRTVLEEKCIVVFPVMALEQVKAFCGDGY